jgi:hypothetical protein
MDIIPLVICFISGITSGAVVGILTAGLFTQRKLARKEKETWAQAENFYRHASRRA